MLFAILMRRFVIPSISRPLAVVIVFSSLSYQFEVQLTVYAKLRSDFTSSLFPMKKNFPGASFSAPPLRVVRAPLGGRGPPIGNPWSRPSTIKISLMAPCHPWATFFIGHFVKWLLKTGKSLLFATNSTRISIIHAYMSCF